jgi:hypothetical protein
MMAPAVMISSAPSVTVATPAPAHIAVTVIARSRPGQPLHRIRPRQSVSQQAQQTQTKLEWRNRAGGKIQSNNQFSEFD